MAPPTFSAAAAGSCQDLDLDLGLDLMDSVVPNGNQDPMGLLNSLRTEDLLTSPVAPTLPEIVSMADMSDMTDALDQEEPFSFLNELSWGSEITDEDSSIVSASALANANVSTDATEEQEPLKADLMWSAPSLEPSSSPSNRQASGSSCRWRNRSLTLSECAESLFSEVDLDGIDKMLNASGDAKLRTYEMDDDDEVDVVSDAASSVSTESADSISHRQWQQQFRAQHHLQQQKQRQTTIAAGRSLLKKPHQRGKVTPPVQTSSQGWNPNNVDQSLMDHCYFATTAPSSPASSTTVSNPASPSASTGLLTPNESSDDEEVRSSIANKDLGRKRRRSEHYNSTMPNGKRARMEDEERVKFKFRMAFKSENSSSRTEQKSSSSSKTSERSLLNSNHNASSHKRKSALKNTHCPSPVKQAPATPVQVSSGSLPASSRHNLSHERLQASPDRSSPEAGLPSNRTPGSGRRSKYAGITSAQKCREIRDLHNHMERQRRVDLKKHFDILKDQVPELVDVDKASKLNILNKASDFCRQLRSSCDEYEVVAEKERVRNALLKKKLHQLMASFKSTSATPFRTSPSALSKARRTSSGRVSLLSGRVC